MIDIIFNDTSSKSHGVFLYDLPEIQTANESYTSTSVAGKRGALISKKGAYDNITIKCTFSILNKKFIANVRDLKKWLIGSGKLIISESSSCYYEVLHIQRGDVERELSKYGKFTVEFICFPYEFHETGDYPTEIVNGQIINEYDECMPEFTIKGEGMCTLVVNGNEMSANVGQSITIDTRRMVSYRDNATMNTSVKGNYNKLHLKNGNNTISITQGFELEVITHWGYNA